MDKHISKSHLGKRSRSDVCAARRTNELEVIQEISERLPISKCQKEKASQATLLRVALNYIKTREMMTVQKSGKRSPLGTCIPEGFSGFVMIVNIEGTIMFVTESIAELVGPHIVDVVGQTVGDLVHTEDEEQICHALDLHSLGRQNFFVIRMKKTMAPTVRSREKVEYKSVFVTSWLKRFNPPTSSDQKSSVAAVMLCKTEFHIGFPEIVIGSSFSLVVDQRTYCICEVDSKAPWLLGYHEEDMLNQSPLIFRHPDERFPLNESMNIRRIMHQRLQKEGVIMIPWSRFLSAWGQWLWASIHVSPLLIEDGEVTLATGRIGILGPDDSIFTPPTSTLHQWTQSTNVSDNVGQLIDDFLSSSTTPPALPGATTLCNSEPVSGTLLPSYLHKSLTNISESSGCFSDDSSQLHSIEFSSDNIFSPPDTLEDDLLCSLFD